MRFRLAAALLAVVLAAVAPARAQAPVKIGLLVTLSGPGAVLGGQVRDGFMLALKQRGNKLGGRPAEVVVVDDELKPDVAASRARRLIESDKVDFVVGPIFSNILGAIFRPVTQGGAILISPNAGSSVFAGRQCSPDFFVTSYENNQVHAVLGEYAQRKGYKRAFLLAPNYQAGKDAVAGFKSRFKGDVVGEDYVPLNQIDFQADLARIADAKPDVIFTFMPGGLGVALVKQFHASGLAEHIPFLSAFTVDESTLPAEKDAALGLFGAMTWAPDMNNAANHKFVEGYLAAYHAVPGSYAMQAYDAAQLIDSALTKTGGDTSDKAKLHAALHAADFASPRGAFRFNTNGYPIQDFYLVKAAKRPDGLFQTEIVERIFADYADSFAKDCPLK
ncbi:MAG: ABC transporter substrate-binding protein [Alphaproteobacteria bacterium]|nr:ABC transporter substrate-binding protein [Alphaproteobacteria bacterium]